MSLDLVNTLASLFTALVIAATAIAALVQLRHMRASNQISAMLTIGQELSSERLAAKSDLVRQELAPAMQDKIYREYLAAMARGAPAPEVSPAYVKLRRATVDVGNAYEELGILVKRGVVDRDMFLDRYGWIIVAQWERLAPVTALGRAALKIDFVWENFEYLAVLAEDWMKLHATGTYPRGMRRMKLELPDVAGE